MQLGDFATGSTVYHTFTLTDGSGVPAEPSSAIAASDFKIYKSGSGGTAKASTAGISVTNPFNSDAKKVQIAIDLSNNTDAGFWASGGSYWVEWDSAKTVDGDNLSGSIVFSFSIQNRYMRGTDNAATAGDAMTLANGAITAAKFDESTAFPLKAADAGSTAVARTGADGDTLETLSDEIAGISGGGLTGGYTRTITVTDSVSTLAIQGAKVRLYRTGETETRETNASGQTTFATGDYTYSYVITAAGYAGATGTIVVSGDGTSAITLTAFTPATPTTADTTVVTVKLVSGKVADVAGVTVHLRPKDASTVVEDAVVSKVEGTYTTDSNGECEAVVPRASAVLSGSPTWQIAAFSNSKCVLDWTDFDLVEDATATIGEMIAATD